MNKLINIRGYWDMFFGTDFSALNMFKGQILLENDGWFEGIVRDPYGSLTEDRFVFGFYDREKGILLNKVTINENGMNYVCSFDTNKDINGYAGDLFEILSKEMDLCGNTYLITDECETQEDISVLRSNLDNLKQNEFLQIFYTDIIERRNIITGLSKMNFTNQAPLSKEMIMDMINKYMKEAIQKMDAKTRRLVLAFPFDNTNN